MVEQKQAEPEEIWAKTECDMLWQMNRECNFNCEYGFREWGDEDIRAGDSIPGKYGAEHVAQRFDETGKVWRIRMTGGEPCLYPDFVELAKALTRRHYISLSTNLSTPNTYELADGVESERVHSVNASVHPLERENRKDGMKEYLRKFLYFQERGFNIRLVYVTYPPLLGRIEEDMERLRGGGVKRITVKVFQGKYRDRRYPRDFSDEERAFIRGLGLNNKERTILACRVSFLGSRCEAGHRAFSMDISGNVTRCSTLKEGYGNLFEGTFKPGESPRRCTARKCSCAYQGIAFTSVEGFDVPRKIVARPVKYFVVLSELFAGVRGKVLR